MMQPTLGFQFNQKQNLIKFKPSPIIVNFATGLGGRGVLFQIFQIFDKLFGKRSSYSYVPMGQKCVGGGPHPPQKMGGGGLKKLCL